MKVKLITVCLALVANTVVIIRPIAAADFSCAQWLAYRTGNTSLNGQGLVLITFLQGYIDGVNEFGDAFNGYLISEVSPGKFAPTPPAPPVTIEGTIAALDRKCTENRAQSAHVVGVNEVRAEMFRRATPLMQSMQTILHNFNEAKGYK